MTLTKAQEAVLALLSELEENGVRAVTKTTLAKLVYLVDYYQAKETPGQTFTGTEWRFQYYGPYASSIAADFDALSQLGLVSETPSNSTEKDYYLYSLLESVKRRSLEEIGLAKRAASTLRPKLKELSSELSKLLNFVYFHTEPMEEALPNDVLDFTICRRDHYSETKPVALKKLPADVVQAYQAKLAERRTLRAEGPTLTWEGPYDELYFQSMAQLDEQFEDATGKAGTLAL